MDSIKLLIVSGSTREASRTRALGRELADYAAQAGAEVRRMDLFETALPLFRSGDAESSASPEVMSLRESADWADAFLFGTPEYHGGLSGALKNAFDWLYEELAGKLAAVYAVTGGGSGDMSITAVKNAMHWCHGFTLPFHAAARGRDFEDTRLVNEAVRERLQRLVHDLIRYGPPLRRAFEAARRASGDIDSGFAGLH